MTNQEFYILTPSMPSKETGTAYPAVESFKDYDFNSPNSVHRLRPTEFPNFAPELRFRLNKGAKLCDMMKQITIGVDGFIISNKLKNIFENSNIIPSKFYPATIEDQKSIRHDYFWVHFSTSSFINHINYEKSSFFIKRFSDNLGEIKIVNENELQIKRKEIDICNTIGFEKIYLSHIDYDLFVLHSFNGVYITKEFKNKLESLNLTGLSYELTNKLSI
jgi:hypothetical protein